jgi:hypothetical protein
MRVEPGFAWFRPSCASAMRSPESCPPATSSSSPRGSTTTTRSIPTRCAGSKRQRASRRLATGRPGDGGALEFLDLPVGYAVDESSGEARRVVNPSNQFISLLERRCTERIRTARCIDHTRAREVAPLRTVSREPMWLTLVHDGNMRNRLDSRLAGEPVDLSRVSADLGFADPG